MEPTACIEGEQAYPIYRFHAKWIEDGKRKDDPDVDGLPEGRVWNSLSDYKMYREPLGKRLLVGAAREWWGKVQKQRANKHPAEAVIVVTFERHETWCLGWFSHWTFDNGQSDKEVLASFARFVERMMPLCSPPLRIEESEYCLMGAEDRWRWRGTKDGQPDNQTEPPCRCKYCKEQGKIRIGH